MSGEVAKLEKKEINVSDIEQIVIAGDLAKLNPEQRLRYVQKICQDTGLNILSRPFDYLNLQGRLVLYANKGAAEQLRKVNQISISIKKRELIGDVYVVTARASMPDGRQDESTGAINAKGVVGADLANLYMKCETKAKRRVTLSISGLVNVLDASEIEDIPREQRSILPTEARQEAEEMAQENGTDERAGYRIPFGKYARRSLEELNLDDLRSYVAYIENKAEKDGKPLMGQVKDFIMRAEEHIAAFESGEIS